MEKLFNIGDNVQIGDDVGDSADYDLLMQYSEQKLTISNEEIIDDELCHYTCTDENGEIIYFKKDVPFSFIDADLKIYEEQEFFRTCDKCGAGMNEGYCCGDGEEYFCSDDCLFTDGYTEEQQALDYEDGSIYWTTWEEA